MFDFFGGIHNLIDFSGKWRDRLRMDKWKTGVLANIKRRIEARSGKKKTEEGANSDQEEADEGVDEEFNPF